MNGGEWSVPALDANLGTYILLGEWYIGACRSQRGLDCKYHLEISRSSYTVQVCENQSPLYQRPFNDNTPGNLEVLDT